MNTIIPKNKKMILDMNILMDTSNRGELLFSILSIFLKNNNLKLIISSDIFNEFLRIKKNESYSFDILKINAARTALKRIDNYQSNKLAILDTNENNQLFGEDNVICFLKNTSEDFIFVTEDVPLKIKIRSINSRSHVVFSLDKFLSILMDCPEINEKAKIIENKQQKKRIKSIKDISKDDVKNGVDNIIKFVKNIKNKK